MIFPRFSPKFYGMKWPRVGAFTDFGGSRYRNPVHFLGTFSNFTLISEFSGLVYYTGDFPGVTLEFGLRFWKSGCLAAGNLGLKWGTNWWTLFEILIFKSLLYCGMRAVMGCIFGVILMVYLV